MEKEEREWNLFFYGLIAGVFGIGMVVIIIMLGDYIVSKETLNEICTELSGEPLELDFENSNKDLIVCKPKDFEKEKGIIIKRSEGDIFE